MVWILKIQIWRQVLILFIGDVDKDMDAGNGNFKNLMVFIFIKQNIDHEFHELPKMDIEMANNDEHEYYSDSKEESDFETDEFLINLSQ